MVGNAAIFMTQEGVGAGPIETGRDAGDLTRKQHGVDVGFFRLQLGLAGHEFVRQCFSWRATAQQFFDLYEEILSRRRRACLS